jgi:hypothetical protein
MCNLSVCKPYAILCSNSFIIWICRNDYYIPKSLNLLILQLFVRLILLSEAELYYRTEVFTFKWLYLLQENRYYLVTSSILYSSKPAGTLIFTTSPSTFPSNAFPIGELTDIFPSSKSASSFETSV